MPRKQPKIALPRRAASGGLVARPIRFTSAIRSILAYSKTARRATVSTVPPGTDADDRLKYGGIRYLTRLSSEWECWAPFEDVALEEQERRPITRDDGRSQASPSFTG